MVGQTLSHFRIVGKIGEGGMGVVYRAEDVDLGREVALKVLHTEFITDDERRKRFMREARTAASVTHPNIATIHEVGEQDGVIFIAMELVEGRTLKRIIREEKPSIDECLGLSVEICEGLARAHQANIVHRDLKPENVVVEDGGRLKILDFGLAKLYEDPTGTPVDDSSGLQTVSAAVTRDGRIMGTVQYMSPEQARGVELDARSDVFSLGIVLYELVTGRCPFQGETVTDTLTSILRDRQEPIARFNPQVPVEFERILFKCLEKEAAQRFENAAAVLADLRKLKKMSDSQPVQLVSDPHLGSNVGAGLPWKRIAGFAAAAALLVALGAGAAAVLRGTGWLTGWGSRQTSLAVLPYENLQERDDPERLGQILQELIITDLSEMESLKVMSSQRLFDIQKQLGREDRATIDRDLATQVARQAGAAVMLTGSISRLGSRWILTSQLIDLDDGTVIKSERIDGKDLYAMVDDLTGVVRGDLGFQQSTDVAVTQRTTSSLAAYQAYLAGVEALNELQFKEAAGQFEKAVELDPSFGKAHYKLAISRWWQGSVDGWQGGGPGEALKTLLDGDVKLSRKDRMLAEAFLALVEMRPADAVPLFEEIAALYPDEKEAWYGLGEAKFHRTNNMDERIAALEPFQRAIDLDPSFSLAFHHVIDLLIHQKRYDEGVAAVHEFIEQDPQNTTWYVEWTRLVMAQKDDPKTEEVIAECLRRIDSRSQQRAYLLDLMKFPSAYGKNKEEDLLLRAQAIDTDALENRIRIGLGQVAVRKGDFEKAEEYLVAAHEADTHDVAALNALFWFYDRTRRYDEAVLRARSLVRTDPDFDPFYGQWIAAAITSGKQEEVDEARKAIESMLEDRDDAAAATMAIGHRAANAYFKIGNLVDAEAILREGLDSEDPATLGRIHDWLGWIALKQGRPAEAAEWFGKALDAGGDALDPLDGLIRTSVIAGETGQAIEFAARLDKNAGGEAWGRARLVEAYLRAGNDAEAEKRIESAQAEFRESDERKAFFRELAQAYLAAGRFVEAEVAAIQAGAHTGGKREAEIDQILAWSLMSDNRPDEAAVVLRDGLKENPDAPYLLLIRAFNSLLDGDAEAAERHARELLDRGPALVDAHVVLAYALGNQGRFEEALDHAERAVAVNPCRSNRTLLAWVLIAGELDVDRGLEMAVRAVDTPEAYDQAAHELACLAVAEDCLGMAYLKQGRYAEAVEQLTEASRARPDHPLIREHLEQAERSLSAGS